jgi:hypothetical protein
MYAKGKGVPKDYASAVRWFRKSSKEGNASAQFELGRNYALGKGILEDIKIAIKWFRKSAEQGNANAKKYSK